jgi:hypothetical protein
MRILGDIGLRRALRDSCGPCAEVLFEAIFGQDVGATALSLHHRR